MPVRVGARDRLVVGAASAVGPSLDPPTQLLHHADVPRALFGREELTQFRLLLLLQLEPLSLHIQQSVEQTAGFGRTCRFTDGDGLTQIAADAQFVARDLASITSVGSATAIAPCNG